MDWLFKNSKYQKLRKEFHQTHFPKWKSIPELEESHYHREYIQRTLAFTQQQHEGRYILDLCSSVGLLGCYLKPLGYHNYVGLERWPWKVSASRVLYDIFGIHGIVLQGMAEEIPFKESVFDIVCLLDVIYFQSIPIEDVIKEIYRVLKPRGYLLMDVPFRPHSRYHQTFNDLKLKYSILKDFRRKEISFLSADRFWVVAQA